MQEWLEAGIKAAKYDRDVVSVWQTIVDKANEALAITPQLLPVLKKAGVVDAGGKGLCVIFAFSCYLTHPQTFFQNSLHLSEEKRIFAED